VLISNAAATSAAPAGLLAGVTPLTATAGDGSDALLGDIRKLLAAIAPAIRPVMIASSVQATSIGVLSQSPLPVIAAPTLAADQIIAVDAAAFASSLPRRISRPTKIRPCTWKAPRRCRSPRQARRRPLRRRRNRCGKPRRLGCAA
jgi:hypothetical protein